MITALCRRFAYLLTYLSKKIFDIYGALTRTWDAWTYVICFYYV